MSLSTWSALACMREMSRASSWVAALVDSQGQRDTLWKGPLCLPCGISPVLPQGRVHGLSSEVLSPAEGLESDLPGLCAAPKHVCLKYSKSCPTTCLHLELGGEVAQGESQLPKIAWLPSGGAAGSSGSRGAEASSPTPASPIPALAAPTILLPKGLQQYGDSSDSLEESVLGQGEAKRWLGTPISSC